MGPLPELADADPGTAGFQVDLYDGVNFIHVRVYPTAICDPGTGYNLAITRAEGSVSLVRPNRPPVGLPRIGPSYTRGPCVGCALNADVSGISDRDGWDPATFGYQWLAGDSEITGATSSSYKVTHAELGKTLKVRVTFTDDRGTEETVTSPATKVVKLPNVEPIGKPVILGTLEVGQTLTADVSGISDPNGMTNATFTYWWNFNGPVRDGEEYTLVDSDEGHCGCSLIVTYTDDAGHEERVRSESIGVVSPNSNSPATGVPAITGTAQVGETLTADTSGIADADGLSGVTFSYQWITDGSAWGFNIDQGLIITGETNSTYTLVARDEGNTFKVRVYFTDDATNDETLTSDATVAVAAQAQTNSEAVSHITVVVTEDPNNVISNFTITWSDADDCSTNYNAYLNIYPGNEPGHETPGSQLHLGSAAFDSTQISKGLTGVQGPLEGFNVELYCGTDGSGRLISRVDIPSDSGRPKPSTYSSEPPLSALSVSHGTLTPTFNSYTSSYTVPDVANDVTRITITATPKTGYFTNFFEASDGLVLVVGTGAIDANGIVSGLSAGCNRVHYDDLGPLIELTDADLNTPGFQVDLYDGENYVHVRVYPTAYCHLGTGYQLTITRAAGSISSPRPNRPVVGLPYIGPSDSDGRLPAVGWTMSADASRISDRDGWDPATFSYQWLADDVEMSGATSPSYTVTDAELGKTLKVRVSFTDDRGTEESVTSDPTRVVKLPNIEPTGKPIILGKLEVGQTLTADVSSISDPNGMTNATFSYEWVNFLGPVRDGREYTLVDGDGGRSGLWLRVTYTDDAGHEQRVNSELLGTVEAAPNNPATGAPSISGTAQVGETLTADVSGIADADGLSGATFSYQWISNDGTSDTDLTGATDSTYTLVADDEGKTIKVQVTFTDDAANEETLVSAATAAVEAKLDPKPISPITVEVTEDTSDPNNIVTNFTVTWSDADDCSANYNAYLNIRPGNRPGHETPGSQLHLGSAATDSTEITKGLSDVQGAIEGFNVELYCGTEGTGRLVSRIDIPSASARPQPGTYSWELPLSALSVSHGTLTPTFFNENYIRYIVPDIANADTRITITATPKAGYTVDFYEESGGVITGLAGYKNPRRPSEGCSSRVYSDHLGPLPELADADPNTPGFQVDLYDGVNHIHVRVYPNTADCHGTGYTLSITRAEGSVSLVRPNRPTTGYVSIGPAYTRGPCVGCPMTADDSSIRDRDGLDNATFSYQWLAADVEIAGATSSGYTVTAAELGKTLKVRVSFTDDRGTEETVTSNATAMVKLPNVEPTGKPIILGTLEVGQTLSADVSGISDPNGLTNATLSYQWANFHGPVRDGEEYTLVDSDEGHCGCSLIVTYTDDAGHEERVRSESIGVVSPNSNSPATGVPAITGTAQVGETLTVDTAGISDADGLTNPSYRYQWIANDGASDTDIAGATSSSYALVAADEGNSIKVKVSFTDDAGSDETLTSTATGAVTAAEPEEPPSRPQGLTGTVHDSVSLTWDDPGDATITGYQILRRDTALHDIGDFQAHVDDTGSAAAAYVDKDVSPERRYVYRIKARNVAGLSVQSHYFRADTPSAPVQNSPATGTPIITGTAQVGETLTADTTGIADADGLSGVTFSYQWISNDGTTDTDIVGAAGSAYSLADSDDGKALKVRVSFTDDSNNEETLTSAATATVEAAPNSPATGAPTITGTAQVGETLTADTTSIADTDGLSGATFSYQWVVNDGTADTDIVGATGSTYSLAASDEGKAIKVRVAFTDDSDNDETLTSGATAAVASQNSPVIEGVVRVGETLTVDTSGIANLDGLSGVTFSYQWISNDGTTDMDITGATGSTYTLTASDEGKIIKVRVTFTLTSAPTEAVSFAVQQQIANSPATGVPSITGTSQVGETLTADVSGIADADGLSGVTFSYQWVANDGTSDTDITGATHSTYTLVATDEGKSIQMKVSFTDGGGNQEELISAATAAVTAAEPDEPPAQPQGLAGTVAHDAVSLTWDDPGDATITSYQILRRDRALHDIGDFQVHVSDTGSAAAAYIDRDVSPEGSYVYRIKARNAAGLSVRSDYFRADTPSAPVQNSPATGVPTIGGTARVGETLTADLSGIADADGLSGTTFSYHWVANDRTSDTDITGATDSTYTLVSADEGTTIKVRVTFTDDAGFDETLTSTATEESVSAQADTTAPTVSSVAITSDPDENDADLGAYSTGRYSQSTNWASGVYRIGDDVKVTVTFNEDVAVTGSPQLELAIGSRNRTAAYEGTEGSAVVFSYTVAEGDTDSDGIAIGADMLTLNSGSIKDVALNNANLSHNALAAQDGHKVDGIRPRISRLFIAASTGGSDGAYSEGEELIIVAEFNEDNPRSSVTGPPRVKLDFNGEEKMAPWDISLLFNSPRDYGIFGYVVQEGDLDSDGVAISANSIDLNGGFIRDPAGNDAVLTHSAVAASSSFIVDAVAPTVSSIAITSDPGSDDTYGIGEKIEVTVTFSENMSLPFSITCGADVVHCEAELELDIGGTARTADYQSHAGADVVYVYTVQAGDADDNGIAIGANKLTGQRIMDAAGKFEYGINEADLSHSAVADDAGHKVSGS